MTDYGTRASLAEARVTTRRETLGSMAVDPNVDVAALASQMNKIAEAEGEWRVYSVAAYTNGLDRFADDETAARAAVVAAVGDLLTAGPDDTWSGRGNEIRRAWFDGVRAAAQFVLRGF